jgi:hypothetical protein
MESPGIPGRFKLECQFTIEAPAPAEALSAAWQKSVELIGLRAELIKKDV